MPDKKRQKNMPATRVNTNDFNRLKKITDPMVEKGQEEHTKFIMETDPLKAEDAGHAEYIVRRVLDDILDEIKQWFMDEYGFHEEDLRNFPELDLLIWHVNGWNLKDAIQKHYRDYCKHCDKARLAFEINRIIHNEADRLRNTVFDECNEREGRYRFVRIDGANLCGGCGEWYGDFRVGLDTYTLPPYHDLCGCFAIYYGIED